MENIILADSYRKHIFALLCVIVVDRVKIWSISGHADRSMFNNMFASCSVSLVSTLDVSFSVEHYY